MYKHALAIVATIALIGGAVFASSALGSAPSSTCGLYDASTGETVDLHGSGANHHCDGMKAEYESWRVKHDGYYWTTNGSVSCNLHWKGEQVTVWDDPDGICSELVSDGASPSYATPVGPSS